MRWIITRELEDARPLADELGLTVVPCIERVDLPWPPWPKPPVLIFVTSAAVARRMRVMTVPPGTRIAALEPATKAVIGRVDVSAEGGAVALASAVKAWASTPMDVLYLTSDVGLEQPEQAEAVRILETVGRVHRHAVYSTRAPAGLEGALASHRGESFVFFSPSAVTNFVAAKGEASAALCVGASTARAWPGPEPLLATVETVKKVLMEAMKR